MLFPYWKSSNETYWRRDANLKHSPSQLNVLGVTSLSRLQPDFCSIPLHTGSDLSSGRGQMSALTSYFTHVPVKLVCLEMGWHHQMPSKCASACFPASLSSPGGSSAVKAQGPVKKLLTFMNDPSKRVEHSYVGSLFTCEKLVWQQFRGSLQISTASHTILPICHLSKWPTQHLICMSSPISFVPSPMPSILEGVLFFSSETESQYIAKLTLNS